MKLTSHRLSQLGIEVAVMQAGMPGIATAELAAAVARSGGIGTLGLLDVSLWEREIVKAKSLAAGHPLCVNLLLPYTRRKHVDVLIAHKIPMVSLFWGEDLELVSKLQKNGIFVFQQVGSAAAAETLVNAGIDGIIAQGMEAGGHVSSNEYLDQLLPQVVAVSKSVPVYAAGGIYSATDVTRVIALGASGVSTGTRFLLSHESDAHEDFKRKLLNSSETVLTRLFGFGWSDYHRVATNAATRRWCDKNGEAPGWLQAINASFAFTRRLLPLKSEIAVMQHPAIPLFSPSTFIKAHPRRLVDCTALYAGENVAQITSLLSAAEIVEELARGFRH